MSVINYYPLDKNTNLDNRYEIWQLTDLGVTVSETKDVELVQSIVLTQWNVIFFDIETLTPQTDTFIKPNTPEFAACEVKLICAINADGVRVYINKDLDYEPRDNVRVFKCGNPSLSFLRWVQRESRRRPTILSGFNIACGFDNAKLPGYDLPAVFNKAYYLPTNVRRTIFTYADRTTTKAMISFDQTLIVDMMLYVSIIHNMNSEFKSHMSICGGLNGMCKYFGVGEKSNCSPEDINVGLASSATSQATAMVVNYCIQDVELCRRLFEKMGGLNYCDGFMSGARISIPLSLGGVQRKTAMLLRFLMQQPDTRKRWEFADNLPARTTAFDDKLYKGGSVYTRSGIYQLRALLDYNSLYPSVCIGYNICHTTFLGYEEQNPELLTMDVHRVRIVDGHTACFTKQFVGLLPTYMRMCLDRRAEYKVLKKQNPGDLLIASIENAWKVLANGAYGATGAHGDKGTFDFYTPTTAASITAAGRLMFQHLASSITALGFESVYGDTDSQFIVARDPTNSLVESDIVRLINTKLAAQGYGFLRIAGELGDAPVNILLTGKKKTYCVVKEGKLKTAGFKPSMYSKAYNRIFRDVISTILADGCFTDRHIGQFRNAIMGELGSAPPSQWPHANDGANQSQCSLFTIKRKKGGGFEYNQLSVDGWMAEFLHQYLGYETTVDAHARYYTRGMSDREIADQLIRPCSAWLKNLDSHTEDPRAELVMGQYVNDSVKYLFYNPGQVQLIPNKNTLEQYYAQLDNLHFVKCVTIGLRCEKVGSRYLVGVDIDSDNPDRIDWWPVNTLGCKSRRGYHLFYYMDSVPKVRQFGDKESRYGQVEIKTGGAGLSLIGYHRSMEFQYETNSLPIAHMPESTMKELLGCANLRCGITELSGHRITTGGSQIVSRMRRVGDHRAGNAVVSTPTIAAPLIADTRIANDQGSDTQIANGPITNGQTVHDELSNAEYSYPSEIEAVLNTITFAEETSTDTDETTDDYLYTPTAEDDYTLVEELKSTLFNTTADQWHDYTGYCVPVFLALQSLLTLDELQDIIQYCKQLPEFRKCTNTRKLDKFNKTSHTLSRTKATLVKYKLFTPRVAMRYANHVTMPVRVLSNTTVKERMTVDDLDVEESVIAIKAPYGHGKTVTVCEYVKQLDPEHSVVVFLTNRITQIDSIKGRLSDISYNAVCQGSKYEEGKSVYVVQYESLYKVGSILQLQGRQLYVIIDEAQSFISQIITTPNKQRFSENQVLAWSLINNSHKLIVMDGELTDLTVQFYARTKSVKRYQYTWTHKKYQVEIVDGGQNQLRAEVNNKNKFADTNMLQLDLEIKRCLELGQRIGICSDEKTMTEKYYNALSGRYEFLLINADHPLQPDTDFGAYRIICWSPSIIHTVSIEANGFDVTFGIFQHAYLEDYKIVNQMHRIRTVDRLVLFIRNLNKLQLNPRDVDTYKRRVAYHEKLLTGYNPFAVTFYKTGNVVSDGYVIKQTAQAKAIRDLQLRCPRTLERYRQLMLPTAQSVELTVFTHETELRWSWQLYPYPIKERGESEALNDVIDSFGIECRRVIVDKKLAKLNIWLTGKTQYSLMTTPEIEIVDTGLIQELMVLFDSDFSFLSESRMYFHDITPERVVIARVVQAEQVHESEVPRQFVDAVIPTVPCVGRCKVEYHILATGVRCPDPAMWRTERVKIKCEHFDKLCYVRDFRHPCGAKEHVAGDRRTKPDGDGWVWGQVRRTTCPHNEQRVWCRDRTDWTEAVE